MLSCRQATLEGRVWGGSGQVVWSLSLPCLDPAFRSWPATGRAAGPSSSPSSKDQTQPHRPPLGFRDWKIDFPDLFFFFSLLFKARTDFNEALFMSSRIPLFPHFFLIQRNVDFYRLHWGPHKPASHYAEPVQFLLSSGPAHLGLRGVHHFLHLGVGSRRWPNPNSSSQCSEVAAKFISWFVPQDSLRAPNLKGPGRTSGRTGPPK